MLRRIILLQLACVSFMVLRAQQFGGNRPGIKWMQIDSDTARIIFPQQSSGKAQRIAAVVHELQKNHTAGIGSTLRKINIVLQNSTQISNGYVALAPYRSEFYMAPMQNAFQLGAVDPQLNLAVHEFRHVQQYGNFRKGLSRVASFILGEEGQAVANAAAVPDWFFEGDAVFNETSFTGQGRGKLPLFFAGYRSLTESGYRYNYMKLRNGSYKNYVPDHYNLGYLLVAYGRNRFGNDIWRSVTGDAVRFKPLFYPFQGAVKKHTGLPFDRFVDEALSYYRQQWEKEKTPVPDWLTPSDKNKVINYNYPYVTNDGSLIVLKSGYDRIPAWYRIGADGKEQHIAVRGIAVDDYYSYNNDRIAYCTWKPDIRWGNTDNNQVSIYDIKNDRRIKVGSPGAYFSPDISHAGDKVVASQTGVDSARLILMPVNNGIQETIIQKKGEVFSYPKFSADDSKIYWITRNEQGTMALKKIQLGSGREETLLPFSNRIIGFLQVQGDTLVFTTTYKGRDEIWALIDRQPAEGPFRMASYSAGLYQGALTGNRIVASAFTADGYRLAGIRALWERAVFEDELSAAYVPAAYDRSLQHLFDTAALQERSAKPYKKGYNLLNLHSWRPYYDYPEYSFTVYGENVLNTFRSELAYTYNSNEQSHAASYTGIYGGTFLQPLFGIRHTWQRSGLTATSPTTTALVNWNELTAYAGLRLPLNLTANNRYSNLTLQATLNTEQQRWTGMAKTLFRNGDFNYVETKLQYSSQVQQALQHIYPRWGHALGLQYRSLINKNEARQAMATAALYLPGLVPAHSLVITGAIQGRDTMQQYYFDNNFPFSRGYRGIDFPRSWKIGVNYHFTLAYPDLGFGQIVYVKRIRANAFYDYTEGKSLRTGIVYPFGTAGGELYFDTRWWNQQPVTFGVRYSRLLNNEFAGTTRPGVWEFILPVTLFR